MQVRFKDVDKLGHVNNAVHLTYFELARMSYFHEVIGGEIDWSKEGLILARNEVDYKAPVLLEDEVWVYVRTSRFGNSSFEMEYIITRTDTKGTMIAAGGKSVLVCFNYELNRTIPVPDAWKAKLAVYEELK